MEVNPNHVSQKFLPIRFNKINTYNTKRKTYAVIRVDELQGDWILYFGINIFGYGLISEFDLDNERLNWKIFQRKLFLFPFKYDKTFT